MLIRGWRLNKKLKTTLPTHPSGKTFRLISFLVPVISRETLPLINVLSITCFPSLRYLDVTSTHKPTTWHSDPHHTSTQHFVHCDNFLLRHFDHVTFFYCDILTLWQFSTATLRPCDILLLWHSDSVTIFYCNTSTMWHFATVTFWLCDNFLLWHSVSKWTDCPSTPKSGHFVTLWHSDPL
jgi:hypothetical protein